MMLVLKHNVNADVAAELGLQGHPQKVNISVLNEQVETTPIDCFMESLQQLQQIELQVIIMNVIDWNTCGYI